MPIIPIATGAELDIIDTGQPDGGALSSVPIVLIHGLLGTGQLNFARLIDWLAPHYRVIAPTLRGYGNSTPKPRNFPADFYDRDAQDILALMDALNLPQARVMGYSDGGETALCAAVIAPERFESVVVWGAVGHFGAEMRPIAQSLFPGTWITPEERAIHSIDNADAFILRWIKGFHQILDSGGDVSLSRAGEISARVLMFLGADDRLNPVSYGEQYIERVRDGRLVVLPCGHAVHDEAWEAFSRIVREFYNTP